MSGKALLTQPDAVQGGTAPAKQVQDEADWQTKAWRIGRMLALFAAVQVATRYGSSYFGLTPPSTPTPPAPVVQTQSADGTPVQNFAHAPIPGATQASPLWPLDTPLSMLLYLSTSPTGSDVSYTQEPLVKWDGLTYGGWKDERAVDLMLDVPESVRLANGSWWIDTVLVKGGGEPAGKSPLEIARSRKELTRFLPKRKVRKEKNLFAGSENDKPEETAKELEDLTGQPIVAHWSRNLTLAIVSDGGVINMANIGPPVQPYFKYAERSTDPAGRPQYYPPVFPNDFWILRENLQPINATSLQLPLRITYAPLSTMKFNLFASMTASFEETAKQKGGSGGEIDELKRMLTETSPWLLVTTAIVTMLHMLFEFLAFSSDVSHWRKKDKDLVGVSLRTILTNCFVQLVVLLYLHDSSEETSFMILMGQGIGLVIEAWKITKIADVRVRPSAPGSWLPYTITFEDKKVLSEEEKKTQEYDRLAFRLVSYAAFPLLAGYTVYSLVYGTHRGWYSFIVTTLAQAIYAFGFVQLIPQLIINYKLKSVAHMPMKAMVYKTLSTVVDDFFAFCIKMPWLHRLACFRDDVVFLILIYQRWIYRVDPSRVNEYGQVAEGKVEPVGDVESKKDK